MGFCLVPVEGKSRQTVSETTLSHSAGHECCGSTSLVFGSHACLLPTHLRYAYSSCHCQLVAGSPTSLPLPEADPCSEVTTTYLQRALLYLHRVSAVLQVIALCQRTCDEGCHDAGGASQSGRPVTLFGDIVEKLCCHPAYRLLSLRSLPQMPPGSIDFTTFTWPAILRRLRQMQITGRPPSAAHTV